MKKTTKKRTAVAAGIAAAGALAAAGYYFYGHKNAKQHRAAATQWMKDFKRDVVRQAKELQDLTAEDFDKIVDNVSATYQNVKNVDLEALAQAASELKNNWKLVKEEVSKVRRSRSSPKRKTSARTTRKTGKKRKS